MAAGLQRKLAAVSTGDQVALLWFPHLDEVSVGRKTSDKWKKQKRFCTEPLARSLRSPASTWGPACLSTSILSDSLPSSGGDGKRKRGDKLLACLVILCKSLDLSEPQCSHP